MRLLLDTNVLIRWLEGRALSPESMDAIADPGNDALVSVVSVWEMGVKHAVGKLRLPPPSEQQLDVEFVPQRALVAEVRMRRRTVLGHLEEGLGERRAVVGQMLLGADQGDALTHRGRRWFTGRWPAGPAAARTWPGN